MMDEQQLVQPLSAFTTKADSLSLRLSNDVTISYCGKSILVNALWDTGATISCISNVVVQALDMVPTGKMQMHSASGTKDVNTYLVDIGLPNLGINRHMVSGSDIENQGLGLLVGMDIISSGDFAISNFNGKTVFTFRYPSMRTIDFTSVFTQSDQSDS